MSSTRKRSYLATTSTTAATATVSNNLVVILSGPTGVGKSDVAAELCQRLSGVVVSADSVQAYPGVQIGANKPTLQERRKTPHLLVNVVEDASQTYNAAEWQQDALFAMEQLLHLRNDKRPTVSPRQESIQAAIDEARTAKGYTADQSVVPVVVGGTMMYLQWLVHGRPDATRPTKDAVQRASLKIQEYQDQEDWAGATNYVSTKGAVFAKRVESLSVQDWYRLRRTLEVAYTCGDDASLMDDKLYSGEREGGLYNSGYDVRCFFLCPADRMDHTKVVDRRCEEMIRRGLVKETTDLELAGQLPEMARRAIGYRQTLDYLQRPDPRDNDTEAFEHYLNEFTTATRRYAKRQMQWFRKEREFLFVPVDVTESKESRISEGSNRIEQLCVMPREFYEKELLPVWNDGEVPRSEQTKRVNEEQGKGMKLYRFERHLLKPGSPQLTEALIEADRCTGRLLKST